MGQILLLWQCGVFPEAIGERIGRGRIREAGEADPYMVY